MKGRCIYVLLPTYSSLREAGPSFCLSYYEPIPPSASPTAIMGAPPPVRGCMRRPACLSSESPRRTLLGNWYSGIRGSRKFGLEDAHRQEDGQRYAQQPDGHYDPRCHPTHGLLALCHFASLLPALLKDVLRDHLRSDHNPNRNHHHLI